MVSLTPLAAQKLKDRLAKEGKAGGALRVRVVAGGCSGLSYQLDFVESPKPGDVVAEKDGARLAVDPKSLPYLGDSVVDYVQTLMKSGFEIKNPKAASSCSCGSSFSVGDTFSV